MIYLFHGNISHYSDCRSALVEQYAKNRKEGRQEKEIAAKVGP